MATAPSDEASELSMATSHDGPLYVSTVKQFAELLEACAPQTVGTAIAEIRALGTVSEARLTELGDEEIRTMVLFGHAPQTWEAAQRLAQIRMPDFDIRRASERPAAEPESRAAAQQEAKLEVGDCMREAALGGHARTASEQELAASLDGLQLSDRDRSWLNPEVREAREVLRAAVGLQRVLERGPQATSTPGPSALDSAPWAASALSPDYRWLADAPRTSTAGKRQGNRTYAVASPVLHRDITAIAEAATPPRTHEASTLPVTSTSADFEAVWAAFFKIQVKVSERRPPARPRWWLGQRARPLAPLGPSCQPDGRPRKGEIL